METTPARTPRKRKKDWPKTVSFGRETVSVYRRATPSGGTAFMVANYSQVNSQGKPNRRFDCYPTEEKALQAANKLVKLMSQRDVLSASMTRDQTIEFASAVQTLAPFSLSLVPAVTTLAEALKLVGDLPNVVAAAKFYSARNKKITPKRVPDLVTELINVKESRGASSRYLGDLRARLARFAEAFQREASNVTTAQIQEWLDNLGLGSQSYTNFRRVLHLLFEFAVARGYAVDDPVEGVERVKVRNGDVQIFKPEELARLLEAARLNYPDFLPCIALGAFAGLRSAEVERLEWSDIDLTGRSITVAASKAKTASRRIVPIHDNLAAWLAPYDKRQGKVWADSSVLFYKRQEALATATAVEADLENGIEGRKAVEWKSNGLRHSYTSYRFAQIGDAGRVAGELGNSAAVVHKHYRELVKPAEAVRWFSITPTVSMNATPSTAANT
jgi:integrase